MPARCTGDGEGQGVGYTSRQGNWGKCRVLTTLGRGPSGGREMASDPLRNEHLVSTLPQLRPTLNPASPLVGTKPQPHVLPPCGHRQANPTPCLIVTLPLPTMQVSHPLLWPLHASAHSRGPGQAHSLGATPGRSGSRDSVPSLSPRKVRTLRRAPKGLWTDGSTCLLPPPFPRISQGGG